MPRSPEHSLSEIEPTDEQISAVISGFKSKGFDTIGYNGESVYGCMQEDIPKGKMDDYEPIGSEEAKELVASTLKKGFRYKTEQEK